MILPRRQVPSTGPLPTCVVNSQLTAANLAVNTNTGQIANTPPQDIQFASFASTTPQSDAKTATVLLPGLSGQGTQRYVLGPAQVTGSQIKSANARLSPAGQWTVNITFSSSGATAWDALAEQQFHAVIGVVVNGEVISAPIMQPNQTSFTSFDGQVQIAGEFTEKQAKGLAASL